MRKRLMMVSTGVVVLALVCAFLLAMPLVQNLYKKEFSKRLDTALALMLSDVESMASNADVFAEKESTILHTVDQNMRISIIDSDGWVVGESFPDNSAGVSPVQENHLNRPEIVQARESGRGYNIRKSDSVNVRYFYAAVYQDGYYIRAALPMTDLDSVLRSMQLCMLAGILVGVLVAFVFAVYTSRDISAPLVKLTEATKHIADGDFESRVPTDYMDEIGVLAKAFNSMANTTQNAFSELDRKRRELEGVLQGMDDGVLAVDSNNNILFLNERARALLENMDLEEGRFLSGNMLCGQLCTIIAQAEKTDSVVHEVLRAGTKRVMTVYAAPLNGGETEAEAGALAVLTDVTEMRRLQQLRSEFVANVTHELKTPLTSIRGFIELLKSGDRDEETRRYFYDVLDIEAERLHHLIDDMLVLSQIENTKEDTSAVRCDLMKEVRSAAKRMSPVAEQSNVTIECGAEEGLFVLSSVTRLQQLFGNLIENAIKYNKPNGKVFITVQTQRQMAIVRVRDTGIGIPQEHLARLFERFYRVDTSRSREIGGTGLGLSIVKHLAVLYNGDVSVESTPGEGSTFIVRLPLAPESKD